MGPGRDDDREADGSPSGADPAPGTSPADGEDELATHGAEDHQSSPDAEGHRSSPDAEDRQPSPDAEGHRSSPDAEDHQSSPDAEGHRSSPDAADHPYGDHWPELREQVWQRDDHECQRCGADDRTLQAHHVVPRSAGGPDSLDNLVTLCRPCHGVIHQGNSSFDDVRDEAPLFPDPDAPAPVARMRDPEDQVCGRCGTEREDPTELVAWTDPPDDRGGPRGDHIVVCAPCAGLLYERGVVHGGEALESTHRLSMSQLTDRRDEATVRPSLFAPDPVSVRRSPRTRRERFVDDTPLRFIANSRAIRWTAVVVLGYVGLVLMLSVL